MKIIGEMCTWNNYEFFRRSFKQMREFCDDVVLTEGCHSRKYPKDSTDGTHEYVQALADHADVRGVEFVRGRRYDKIQRIIRSEGPKGSRLYEPGNWIIHWDDDEFYFPKHLDRYRHAMETTDADALAIPTYHFIYNFRFNFYWQGEGLVGCYRILDNSIMRGMSKHCHSDGRPFKIEMLKDVKRYHFSYVKDPARMAARWVMSVEKGNPKSRILIDRWAGVKWEKDEDIWIPENQAMLKAVRPQGRFNIYEGNHPPVLNDHPWRNIKDSREIE